MKGTVEQICCALTYLRQPHGRSLLSSLSHLELLVEGYEGTVTDIMFAGRAAERCLALSTTHRRSGHNLEAFRVSSCLLKSDHLQKYADIGVKVEVVAMSAA